MRAHSFIAWLVWIALALALVCSAAVFETAAAGVVTLVSDDGPAEGLNDPTPAAPVGGNSGATVGAQRRIALQLAADIWGAILNSSIEIRVRVDWGVLDCDPGFGFLGFAGPQALVHDFANTPRAGAWFVVAEANKLAHADLDGDVDIRTQFNSNVGTAACLTDFTWYYGLDNHANASTQFDLVTTALHELAHGLGQLTYLDLSTGAPLLDALDMYSTFLHDNTTGKSWAEMTNAERAASARNFGNVVWRGDWVERGAPSFLRNRAVLDVQSPPAIAGAYDVGTARFGGAISLTPLVGEVVLADDETGTPSDACQPILNDVAGKIALIDRGSCRFAAKVHAAQDAGAIAAILVNNVPGPVFTLGGDDATITIPAALVTQSDGARLRGALAAGVTVALRLDPRFLAGADDAGHVKIYTPDPLEPGSSVSHWDPSATPDLLLEPLINPGIAQTGDLSLDVMRDIGWFPEISPVAIEDFHAVSTAASVRLVWRLSSAAIRDVAGVRVERSETEAGPWARIAERSLAPAPLMAFEDPSAAPGEFHWYRIALEQRNGATFFSPPLRARSGASLETSLDVPVRSRADGALHIRYRIGPAATAARLDIYDVAGRRLRSVAAGRHEPGEYVALWDGRDDRGHRVARGVYVVRLATTGRSTAQRFALSR